jgi:hypothetical protein
MKAPTRYIGQGHVRTSKPDRPGCTLSPVNCHIAGNVIQDVFLCMWVPAFGVPQTPDANLIRHFPGLIGLDSPGWIQTPPIESSGELCRAVGSRWTVRKRLDNRCASCIAEAVCHNSALVYQYAGGILCRTLAVNSQPNKGGDRVEGGCSNRRPGVPHFMF